MIFQYIKNWFNLFFFLLFVLTSESTASNPIIIDSREIIKCPINRDTSISSVGSENIGSNGDSSRLKLKSIQEYILCDADVSSLKGLLIKKARLHFKSVSPFNAPVKRMGISTIASEWVEGSSHAYKPEKGASCFLQAEYGQKNWAYEGSTFMDVVFGRGHTLWDSVECIPPDKNRWQQVEFDPDLVAARIVGISNGFCLYDDVGSEWNEDSSGRFSYNVLPNRFIFSTESFISEPWLELETCGKDFTAPEPVDSICVATDSLPVGEAFLFWATPLDHGGGKTLGFDVSYKVKDSSFEQNSSTELMFPRYLIPKAGKPSEKVKMHIRDIDFTKHNAGSGHFKEAIAGAAIQPIEVSIVSVDTAGNRSKPFVKQIVLSNGWSNLNIPQADITPFSSTEKVSDKNKVSDKKSGVSVIDLLDKYIPETKQIIPTHEEGYKQENHIFSDSKKLIRLHGAKNEDVWFQVLVDSAILDDISDDISFESIFENEPFIKPVFYKFENVKVKSECEREVEIPDPLIPVEMVTVNSKLHNKGIGTNSVSAYIGEIFIPHNAVPGLKKGSLIVKTGDRVAKFNIELMVWNFTLPDKLSFVPEMNAYSSVVSPYRGYEFYRLAHRHRTCLNWLPYGWNGLPEFAPERTVDGFLWDNWDKYIRPLVTGSAFHDLPRQNQPVDVMYLPLSENWPVPIHGNYKKSWWADEALSDSYKQNLKQAFADFAEHLVGINGNLSHSLPPELTQTNFQFYLNNKVYYREKFKQSSAPWIFDEPIHIQDFMALKWYGQLWHEAVDRLNADNRLCFRGDISYTQFGRDILWGITDIEYLGGNNAQKTRMKQDEFNQSKISRFAEYGSANKISDSNLQPVLWELKAWSRGACGVLPWQTIGSEKCWEIGEQTALFYPKGDDVFPSVRLKAFQYGQQLVEYLVFLAKVMDVPEVAVRQWLINRINLNDTINKTHIDDAGTVQFQDVSMTELWKIRYEMGQYLSHSPRNATARRPVFHAVSATDSGLDLNHFIYSASFHISTESPKNSDCLVIKTDAKHSGYMEKP